MDMVHSGAFVCSVFKCKDRFLCVSNHRKLLNVLGKSIHHHNVYFTIFDQMGYTVLNFRLILLIFYGVVDRVD